MANLIIKYSWSDSFCFVERLAKEKQFYRAYISFISFRWKNFYGEVASEEKDLKYLAQGVIVWRVVNNKIVDKYT